MTHRLKENPPLPGKGDDGLDQSLRIRVTNDFDPNDSAFETGISVRAFADSVVQAARVAMTKGRGTSSSPQPVEELDFIGEVRFSGYYGNTHDDVATGALIQGQASEDWDPTHRGMDIVFWTITPATAILEERIRINTDGLILTGDFTVTGGLTFSTLALNGAISIAGSLDVTGDLTIGGDFLFDDDLNVTGLLTAEGDLVVGGVVQGNFIVLGPIPEVNVLAHGADPTGATDSTAAIQAAINAARAILLGPAYSNLSRAAIVRFPFGLYLVSSLDCTYCAGLELVGKASWGAALYANKQSVSSKPVLDFTGSSSFKVSGITVHGQNPNGSDPAVLPSCGLLMAQSANGADSNKNHLEDFGTLGKFTVASVYVYGSTDNYIESCAFQQKQNGVPCLLMENINTVGMSSPYVAIATGTQNTGEMTFVQVECHDLAAASGPSTVHTVQMRGVYAIRFLGGNNSNSGPGHIYLLGTCRNISICGTEFYSDNDTASEAVILTNGTGVDGLTLDQCDYEPNIGAILKADPTGSSIEGVNIQGKITSAGFSGMLADMAAGSDIKNGIISCDGLEIDVSMTGTLAHLLLINPGAITAGTDTSTVI